MSQHWYLFDQGVHNGIDEIERLDVTSRREAITAASLAWGRLSPRMQGKRDEFYVALIEEHFADDGRMIVDNSIFDKRSYIDAYYIKKILYGVPHAPHSVEIGGSFGAL